MADTEEFQRQSEEEVKLVKLDSVTSENGAEATADKKKKKKKKKNGPNGQDVENLEPQAEQNGGVPEDDEQQEGGEAASKSKKKKKKKSKGASGKAAGSKPPPHRGVTGFVDSYLATGQTDPPTIPVSKLFKPGESPVGEIMEHPGDMNTYRITSAELRDKERLEADLYDKVRQASEVHRQVRKFAQGICKPGIRIADFCEALENKNRELIEEQGMQRGIGFPTGVSLNHVAAHWTPNPGDETVLQYGDVMKVDFGCQIDGRIIDSAYTVCFDPQFDNLLEAVRMATNAGIKAAGIDARLGEVGGEIQEVMESYEVTINGETFPVKPIRNLNGHSIAPYQIHGGKSVPIVKGGDLTKMEEGEFYAIETFGSTGRGYVIEDLECSHYGKIVDAPHVPLRLASAKKLLTHINKTFGTLPFCRRWLERPDGGSHFVNGNNGKQEKYIAALKNLCDNGIVQGSYTAQYEHTLVLRPTCKEILSRGDDF